MIYGAQAETIVFLSSLDGGAQHVAATHISYVVLCATRAYKLKRAVAFPYLDFSTPQKRLAMCEREAALNRRLAPQLYLGARRVMREENGALTLDGEGELVDAIVEMRRFDEEMLFDNVAATGRLTKEMIEALIETLAAFHATAPPDFSRGGYEAMRCVIEMNAASARSAGLASGAERAGRESALLEALTPHASLLDARRGAGKVRHCHGDLTLRNICLFESVPTPFDCLEFSDDLATIDILYDLAFLLMDLLRAGAPGLANVALNRYLDHLDETEGLPLLPVFMAMRASIRAHVAASQSKDSEARAYSDLAGRLPRTSTPRVVAIGGFSGCGKSSLAARLAPHLGAAPGARILNSDRLRKQMFNAAPTERLPQEAYASEVSARVYGEMFDAAKRAARSGWSVVSDAVFDRPEDRAAIETIAREAGVSFQGFWLDAALEQRAARVDARRNDVSDATREVLALQAQRGPGNIGWARLDASRGLDALAADAFDLLGVTPPTEAPRSPARS